MEHGLKELRAGSGLEDVLQRGAIGGLRVRALIGVDKEVGLHQNLMVVAVDGGVGVVMAHEPRHALDKGLVPAKLGQHPAHQRGAFLLLKRAGAGAVFFQTEPDGDVVDDGRGLEDLPAANAGHALAVGDERGVGVHLGEVLNALRVGIEVHHGKEELLEPFVHNYSPFRRSLNVICRSSTSGFLCARRLGGVCSCSMSVSFSRRMS